jgi:hypothetical protein
VSPTVFNPCPPLRGDADFWTRYETYLASPEWESKRRRVLGRAGYICEGGGRRKAEHVHHLTYAHFGDARFSLGIGRGVQGMP